MTGDLTSKDSVDQKTLIESGYAETTIEFDYPIASIYEENESGTQRADPPSCSIYTGMCATITPTAGFKVISVSYKRCKAKQSAVYRATACVCRASQLNAVAVFGNKRA